jgi:hypothetical protein
VVVPVDICLCKRKLAFRQFARWSLNRYEGYSAGTGGGTIDKLLRIDRVCVRVCVCVSISSSVQTYGSGLELGLQK